MSLSKPLSTVGIEGRKCDNEERKEMEEKPER